MRWEKKCTMLGSYRRKKEWQQQQFGGVLLCVSRINSRSDGGAALQHKTDVETLLLLWC